MGEGEGGMGRREDSVGRSNEGEGGGWGRGERGVGRREDRAGREKREVVRVKEENGGGENDE